MKLKKYYEMEKDIENEILIEFKKEINNNNEEELILKNL